MHKQLDFHPAEPSAGSPGDSELSGGIECLPIHGSLTWRRWLLYRAAVALPLLVVVVCPALAVLWLFLAASWYVLVGQEMKRRADIEARRARLLAEGNQ